MRLGKECQSRNYDALVAHTTIVFTRYIWLALAQRMNNDPRTLGTLFHAECDELRQVTFMEALTLLLRQLEQLIKAFAELITTPIKEMLEEFMARITSYNVCYTKLLRKI